MSVKNLIAVWLTAMAAVAAEPVVVGLSVIKESHGLPARALTAMAEEADRILGPAGVLIRWSGADAGQPGGEQRRLVVVKLVGAAASGVALKGGDDVLAVTHMSEGRILPFIDMDVRGVARTIQRLGGFGRPIQPAEYGRALGRVLAHELYHVLSGSVIHDGEGVAKGALGAAELVGGELRLSAAACRRIREALGLAVEP
ncbi:MAG: hypothetical protein C0504_19360 [Candidatus Solibacter sp.]|nr:hypothetical protein [Candidatus Solibacter sp.]